MTSHANMTEQERLNLVSFQNKPEEAGLSLDQLNAAFAQMLGKGHDPYATIDATSAPDAILGATGEFPADLAGPVDDPARDLRPRSILEAMLFVGSPDDEVLTTDKVAGLMRGVRPQEVTDLVRELNHEYRANRCPYEIVSAGAGYRLALRTEFEPIRDRCYQRNRRARLSQAAIEVLSIVAYHQPITVAEINRLRDRPSAALLRQLVRRQLLRVEKSGQAEAKPLYRTTPRFLELFHLDSLEELPRNEELDAQ